MFSYSGVIRSHLSSVYYIPYISTVYSINKPGYEVRLRTSIDNAKAGSNFYIRLELIVRLYVTAKSASEMNVLDHQRNAAGMNRAKHRILEETCQVAFSGGLHGKQAFSRPSDLLTA